MKKNYRILAFLLALVMLVGCAPSTKKDEPKKDVSETENKVEEKKDKKPEKDDKVVKSGNESKKIDRKVKLVAIKGPTAIGLAKFIEDNTGKDNSDYEFTMASIAQEVVNGIAKKEFDMAAIPANLASTVYNKTQGKIQVLAVNTLGVVYIVDNSGEIKGISDLKGKTIYVPAKGQTPEYILKDVLKKSGLKEGDYTLEYKGEPAEIAALLNKGENIVGLLPEPFITAVKTKNSKINTAIDLNAEWKKLNNTEIVTGVLVANREFIEQNKELVVDFLAKYKESIEFAKNNREESSKLIEKLGVVKAPVAIKALEKLNIAYMDGEDLKNNLSKYLQILFSLDPKSVGGKLPADDFYFSK